MQRNFLEKRVENVEKTVAGLSELPARVAAVEGQILQLRTEMHAEFSAIRNEVGLCATRSEMRALHEDSVSRIRILAEGVDDTREQLRVLKSTTVAKAEFEAFRTDVMMFQKVVIARLSEFGAFQREVGEFQEDVTAWRSDVSTWQKDVIERLSDIAD